MFSTPLTEQQRQELGDAHHAAQQAAHYWYQAFESLAYARDSIRKACGDRCFVKHHGETLEFLNQAASSLSRFVSEAMKRRDEANAELNRVHAILLPKPDCTPLTDQEFADLGERMAANPKAITSNTEGAAFIAHLDKIRVEKIDREGCCGEKPSADGYCFGFGKCPRFEEIERCERFVSDYLAWLEQINEQSGLAAVAARLCVESPVIESELSNV